jgi:TolB-like protein/Tfp pilus assembly protein PilF
MGQLSGQTLRTAHFADFELNFQAGELRQQGRKIRLQGQPVQILAMLLERPGELITREELRQKLWPADRFVDFEHGLNAAVKRLRQALGDSAEHPRFVETLARRGYRFIATLDKTDSSKAGDIDQKKIRLAVLPFENLSPDPEQDYFSDGLTEEMISHLGPLNPQRLGVIARTSSMRYKGMHKGIDQIGQELNVDYILEGSVRRAGTRARITAQLIQVKDQTPLWADRYDRELSDIFAIQDEVAEKVGRSLALELLPQHKTRLSRAQSVAAHDAYLWGRFYWNQGSEAGLQSAIQCLEQALGQDPDYAPAYVGIADCYAVLGWFGALPPREAIPKAKAAAHRALQIEDSLGEAHFSLARVSHYEWNWSDAETEFKRGLDLNSNYATGRRWYAQYLSVTSRHSEAIQQAKRAGELDPFSPITNSIVGWAFYNARQYDQAVEQCLKTLEMDRNFWAAHLFLGLAYEQKGMYSEALSEVQKSRDLSGNSAEGLPLIGRIYALTGKRHEAQKILDELKELSQRRYLPPSIIAIVHAGLGDKKQAFAWLDKAYDARDQKLELLKVSPLWDSLRLEPRFEDLMQRVFPQS